MARRALGPLLRLAAVTALPIRLVEWNVYYKALDDPFGRAAIVDAIDNNGALDFGLFAEAAGDTPGGAFEAWRNQSKVLRELAPLTATSRHETLAILYDGAKWRASYSSHGEFEPGRPYLLAYFENGATGVWVVLVHLPHFLDTKVSPGAILAAALRNASASSGAAADNVIIGGDFNEFEWEDNPWCALPSTPPSPLLPRPPPPRRPPICA